jgi:hypothetical protein
MIQDTIAELEGRIAKADAIKPESKAELLELLRTLRAEISGISETYGDDAESIAGFARLSAHEALRQNRNPRLMELSLEGLGSSVNQFESSHPGLVRIVNRICETLANLGI